MHLITPLALAAALTVAQSLPAQVVYGTGTRPARVTVRSSDDRPVLGITTSSGGARDTLGLLVATVTPGGPADSAGIEEGNRLVAINGVNLRLSAADAGEPDMAGVLGRRLQREMDRVTAGDEVELRVWADGRTRPVRVKTVRADALQANHFSFRGMFVADDGATIGASVGGMPSPRDTLGVFVVAVNEDGPLARAGIIEGARIASINDTDLRVPIADAGDEFMTNARIRRFHREVERLEPDANVSLRVYVDGEYRTVNVQAIKRSELEDDHAVTIFRSGGGNSFHFPEGSFRFPQNNFDFRENRFFFPDTGAMRFQFGREFPETIRRSLDEAQTATGRAAERLRDRGTLDEARTATERALNQLRERRLDDESEAGRSAEQVLRALEERIRELESSPEARARLEQLEAQLRELEARLRARGGPGGDAAAGPTARQTWSFAPAVIASGDPIPSGTSRVFTVSGVRFSPVDAQLASYLGSGSDRGLLVLDVDSRWSGIRAGDVVLSIDGRPVRDGNITRVALRAPGEYRVELVRAGTRVTEIIRAH